MDGGNRIEALITILDYSLKDRLINTLKACEMPAAFLVHGLGTAKSVVYDILGYGGPKKSSLSHCKQPGWPVVSWRS